MYIKSIDEAVRKAVSDASHLFKDRDVEQVIKEACEKANQRISIKMPVTIATPNEPWIYISSALTADRNFELFVIVNLTDVTEDYLKAKVFQGIFYTGRPRPVMSLYEKSIMIKAEDYESYVGPAAVKNFANYMLESGVLQAPEFDHVLRSLRATMTTKVASMPDIPKFVDDIPMTASITAVHSSAFEAPGYSRAFSLKAPSGIINAILDQKSSQAKNRFNESIEMQLFSEYDGNMEDVEAVKAVSKCFGGLFTRPGDMITRLGYDKAAMLSEGKSYALAHVREAIKHAEVHSLVAENPLWGSW
ncbi:TPA: hypothetical protein RRJ08_004034 [Klebsiella pneumoniae]|nr:hypothetical protein [Klebsiella pneumoniae]ELP0880825.1 hypothetical protein [Klebsiella pneumoniae]HDY9164362.1 hypothetical protein [Klebsiella pneumoniae]